MLFNCKNNQLTQIKEKPIRFEKELQRLMERNLETIFRLKLIKSEYVIENKKIDTLAYDPAQKSFIIIEYKREKTLTLFDQGIAYLNLMLQNKDLLRTAYNDSGGAYLKHGDIKWKNIRIVFIAPEFTSNQLHTADFWLSTPLGRDYPIELWEVKMYENGSVFMNPVKRNAPAGSSSEELLTGRRSKHTLGIYNEYKKRILKLNKAITINPQKREIGFMLNEVKFADVSLHRGYIKMWLNVKRGMLTDPKKLLRDVSKLRHWGCGDYEITLYDTKDIDYVIRLVKETIDRKKAKS